MLDGLAIAAIAVFPRRIRALVSWRRIGVAAASFLVGASPLIYYNAVRGEATFDTGAVMSGKAPLSQKLLVLEKTMSGNVLFGWLTDETRPDTAVAPGRFGGKLSVALNRAAGSPRSNWLLYACIASCCLVPWLWFTPSRRPAVFVMIYLAVTWGQMLLLANTGATLHHVILLWPFPHMLIAIAGAQLAHRIGRRGVPVLAALLVAMTADNLLVVNHYFADLTRLGTTVIWTDAIGPLYRYLDSLGTGQVVTVDWGYSAPLCLLSDGELPLRDISYQLLGPSGEQAAWIQSLMGDPRNAFVDHAEGGEQFPNARERLASIAAAGGFRKELLTVITDRNQRPRFNVFRYVPDPQRASQ